MKGVVCVSLGKMYWFGGVRETDQNLPREDAKGKEGELRKGNGKGRPRTQLKGKKGEITKLNFGRKEEILLHRKTVESLRRPPSGFHSE